MKFALLILGLLMSPELLAAEEKLVVGIGGVFFRANNPPTLSAWYTEHLGISPVPSTDEEQPWQQEAGPTVFTPMHKSTAYLGNPDKQWMINFRVRNLDLLVTRLRASKIEVSDPDSYANGRFARLIDPEGNHIELWEPTS
jgi:glyoxylase I family protein